MIDTYEIRIRQRGNVVQHVAKGNGIKFRKIIKMFHFDARTRKQAIEQARKHKGDILSCRKVSAESKLIAIEHLPLEEFNIYDAVNPFKNAVAMDEAIWNKRNKRRANMQRDKDEP